MISPSCISTPSLGIIISKAIYKIPRATRKRLKIRCSARQPAGVDGRFIFQAFRSGSVKPSGSLSPFYLKLQFLDIFLKSTIPLDFQANALNQP
ncbi:hypothetical protein ACXOJ5_08790, partial [Streptococcus thermophilus]